MTAITSADLNTLKSFFGSVRYAENWEAAILVALGLAITRKPGSGIPKGTKVTTTSKTRAAKPKKNVKKKEKDRLKKPPIDYEDLAEKATRNPSSNKVILGKYLQERKSYTKVGAHFKGSYFKLENWRELAQSLTQDELWKINEAFLRQQIRQGKQIFFSHDPSKATGFFAKEVKYLKSLGYKFEQDGWIWKAVR